MGTAARVCTSAESNTPDCVLHDGRVMIIGGVSTQLGRQHRIVGQKNTHMAQIHIN